MIKEYLPDNVVEQIFNALPESARQAKSNVKNDIKNILSSALANLNLVTREEFDIQTKVLQATRARIEALEKQLKLLDNKK